MGKRIPNGAYKTAGAAKRACREADEFIIYQTEYGFGWAGIASETADSIRRLGEYNCDLAKAGASVFQKPGTGIKATIVETCIADPGGRF